MGLGILIVITVLAGYVYLSTFLRYAEQQQNAELLSLSPEVSVAVLRTPMPDAATGGAIAGDASANKDVASLHGEIAALQQLVERHDKMLRYIMDRYLEKDGRVRGEDPSGVGGELHGVHEAKLENQTVVEPVGSDVGLDREATKRNALRGRSRGGASVGAGLGSPELESYEDELPSAADLNLGAGGFPGGGQAGKGSDQVGLTMASDVGISVGAASIGAVRSE